MSQSIPPAARAGETNEALPAASRMPEEAAPQKPSFDLSSAFFSAFRRRIHGQVIARGNAEFDAARRVYNGDANKMPFVVVRVSVTVKLSIFS